MILPQFFLEFYGSAINGLVTSITQFLSFISFLDLGVGAVVQTNLYRPLADNDNVNLSKIIISAKKFLKRLRTYIFFMLSFFYFFTLY